MGTWIKHYSIVSPDKSSHSNNFFRFHAKYLVRSKSSIYINNILCTQAAWIIWRRIIRLMWCWSSSSGLPSIIAYYYCTDGIFFSFGLFCLHVYTDPGKPRVIYSWIENKPDKTYYSLAINGHTIYRINYPEKLFKWYHVCQSWNGHSGEWQLWINSERVGRGFYNLVSSAALICNTWGSFRLLYCVRVTAVERN